MRVCSRAGAAGGDAGYRDTQRRGEDARGLPGVPVPEQDVRGSVQRAFRHEPGEPARAAGEAERSVQTLQVLKK